MLEECTSTKERWCEVNVLLDRWLEERQEVLVKFCSISGIRPMSDATRKYVTQFKKFCQVLVDYVSAGHFEVYEQLMREARDFGDQSIGEAAKFYTTIAETTEVVLAFNDKCMELGDGLDLAKDLSNLGEALEVRFEAEDKLIELLHDSHRHLVA